MRRIGEALGIAIVCAGLWAGPARGADQIYWTGFSGEVSAGSIDGGGPVTTLFSGQPFPYGVTVDPTSGRIYWGGFPGLRGGPLSGGNANVDVLDNSADHTGPVVDPAGGTIYMAQLDGTTVSSMALSGGLGGGPITTLHSPGGAPNFVVVDPPGARMYWTREPGFAGAIQSAALQADGPITTLYSGNTPAGLAVDLAGQRVSGRTSTMVGSGRRH